MAPADLRSFLGHHCQMMVFCAACGGTHVHEGLLAVARDPGEVQMGGRAYPLSQVRAVIAAPSTATDAVHEATARIVFDLALVGGVALAALTALRLLLA